MGVKSKKKARGYHHGDLAESLLEAVDHIARRFGLEAVTLRACAKLVGVAPSAGFRHYADKRALFTAFATRAQQRMAEKMSASAAAAKDSGEAPFLKVGLAYVGFALDEPAAFQVMWRSEMIYGEDPDYHQASETLAQLLSSGFADSLADDDAHELSTEELLAWSVVHGLASLYTAGPLHDDSDKREKLQRAEETLALLVPTLTAPLGKES